MVDKLKLTKAKVAANGVMEDLLVTDSSTQQYIRSIKMMPNTSDLQLSLQANGIKEAELTTTADTLIESEDTLLLGASDKVQLSVSPKFNDLHVPVYMQQGPDYIKSVNVGVADTSNYVHAVSSGDTAYHNSNFNAQSYSRYKPAFISGKHYIYHLDTSGNLKRANITDGDGNNNAPLESVTFSDGNQNVKEFCFNHDYTEAWIMKSGVVFSHYTVDATGLIWTKDSVFGNKTGYTTNHSSDYFCLEYIQSSAGEGWLVYWNGSGQANDTSALRSARSGDLSNDYPVNGVNSNYVPNTSVGISNFVRLTDTDSSSNALYRVGGSSYSSYTYFVRLYVNDGASPAITTFASYNQGSAYQEGEQEHSFHADYYQRGNSLAVLEHSTQTIAFAMGGYSRSEGQFWLQITGYNKYMGIINLSGRVLDTYCIHSNPPELDGHVAETGVMPVVDIRIESVETEV